MSISSYQSNLENVMKKMTEEWEQGLKSFCKAVVTEVGNVLNSCVFTTVDAGSASGGVYTGSGKLQSYTLQDTSALLEKDFKNIQEPTASNPAIAKMIMDRIQQAVTGGTLMIISTGTITIPGSPPVTIPGTGTGKAVIQLPANSGAAATLGVNFQRMTEQSTITHVAQYIADAVKTSLSGMVYTVAYTTGNIAGTSSVSATITVT